MLYASHTPSVLGDAFDIKVFHERVLENGSLPLGALRDHVQAWIEDEQSKVR